MTPRELFEVKTASYVPPAGHRGSMDELGLPIFTMRQINLMLRDSQIKLGIAIKNAPLMHMKWDGVTGDPKVAAFAAQQMKVAWDEIVPKMASGTLYRTSFLEPLYRKNKSTGLVELNGAKGFYPGDCEFLEINRQLVGIRVKIRGSSTNTANGQQDLYGMKALIYIHKQIFGSRDGVSELEGAYPAWLEKSGPDGALAVRRLWFYKNSFDSGILFHPPGMYQYNKGDGQLVEIPYRDLARQAIERAASGAVWAFPNTYDSNGHRLWEYIRPQMNGDGEPAINYVEQLNTEMLRGMGIPDDIISQTSGTGSYAGRSIPFQAFLTSQNDTIRAMFHAIMKQVVLPLCFWNFGSMDVEFHGVQVDRDKLLPPDQPAQGPGQAPPSQDPAAQAQVDPQQAQDAANAIQPAPA